MTGCTECHGERDFTKYAGPVVAGSEGKAASSSAIRRPQLTAAEQHQNTSMPWYAYSGTREDLGAIYTYLRTLKPIVNRVKKHN